MTSPMPDRIKAIIDEVESAIDDAAAVADFDDAARIAAVCSYLDAAARVRACAIVQRTIGDVAAAQTHEEHSDDLVAGARQVWRK